MTDEPDLGLRRSSVDLDRVLDPGVTGDGVHWSLAGSSDLNVNLVHLDGGSTIAEHVNRELDVVLVVLRGYGRLLVDDIEETLAPHTLAHVARGTRRSIHAGAQGIDYLTVHRRRGGLAVGRPGG